MKIKRIELFNLGPYIDKNTFDINCNRERHIVLIGGKNGAGKTTFFRAIKTCLYGCKVWGFEAPGKEYFRQIASFVNSRMQFDSNIKAYVEVELEFDDGKQINYFVLRREWYRIKKGIEEKFVICKNGCELDRESSIDFSNYLLSIIPPDMFNFYFFDGESIADFFLGSDGSRNFRNAFLKLYGLDTLSLMVENFARALKRSGNSSNAYETYQEILAKTKEQVTVLERYEGEKKDLINQLDVLQVKLLALKEDYEKSGGVSLEDWKRLNSELVREETQREEYNRWLKDFANHYLPFIIVEKQLNSLLCQIETEKEAKKQALMVETLSSESLREKLSAFLSASKIDGAYAEQILAFVRDAAVQSVDAKAIFDFSDAQLTRIVTQIYEKLEFDKVLAKKVLKSIKSSLLASKKIRNIMMGSNVDRYEEYAKQKEELGNSIKELTIRIEQLNQEISLQTVQVDQCQKELEKAKEAYEKLLKSRSIGNMAERAIGVYSRLEEQLIERQGKILQDEFLNCFSSIINKDNFIDGIIIDKNINVIPYKFVDVSFLQIDNYLKNDEKSHFLELFDVKYLTDINDLRLGKVDSIKLPAKITAPFSQGERQVYIMALYLALLKTSRKDIPFFIDTPFARIDSNHRDRIVKRFFRGIENQIFILSTDEEIVGQYELLMDDAISNKFLLKINAYGYTQVLANQYFEVAE